MSQGCTQNNWIEIAAPHGSIVRVQTGGKEWTMLASEDPGFAVSACFHPYRSGRHHKCRSDRCFYSLCWKHETLDHCRCEDA